VSGPTRRDFLRGALSAGLAWQARGLGAIPRLTSSWPSPGRPSAPNPALGYRGDSAVALELRYGPTSLPTPLPSLPPAAPPSWPQDFGDLRQHVVFEYYPWYAVQPIRHWDQWDRVPPDDIAANSVPRLGPYQSRDRAVLEQHARWILEAGAGSINLSWWGPGSFEDRSAHTVMDVMTDHGIKVTFHLEPYAPDRAFRLADDVLYLLREYGERRGYDALLLLRNRDGSEGPVLKSFRTILPERYVDCHGVTRAIEDYTPDDVWRRQTDRLRNDLSSEFDHVTLLADSLEFRRTPASGFDGIAIYDSFVTPEAYRPLAAGASEAGLLSCFNVNAGFDGIEPRVVDPDSCYTPIPFEPGPGPIDWTTEAGRELAADRARQRIEASLSAALSVQLDPAFQNARRGFFLLFINSFNEWHEGTAFEPALNRAALTDGQLRFGYHNPRDGSYRLSTLRRLLEAAQPGLRFDPAESHRLSFHSPPSPSP